MDSFIFISGMRLVFVFLSGHKKQIDNSFDSYGNSIDIESLLIWKLRSQESECISYLLDPLGFYRLNMAIFMGGSVALRPVYEEKKIIRLYAIVAAVKVKSFV